MISPAHLRGMTVAWSALLLRHVLATNPQMPSKPASRALVIPRLPIARPAVYTLIVADHKTEIAQRGATQNAETSRAKFRRSHISREFRRAATLNFSGPPMIFLLQYLDLKANHAPSVLREVDLVAPNTDEAVAQARERRWPDNASSWRLVDMEGREIASAVRAARWQ